MDTKPSNAAVGCIEGVTEEFDVSDTTCNGLVTVDFEVKFLLYEVSDALFDTLCSSWSLAKDYTIIGVANERMSTLLQLLVKFIKNDITEKWAERTTLRCTDTTLLNETIDHYS